MTMYPASNKAVALVAAVEMSNENATDAYVIRTDAGYFACLSGELPRVCDIIARVTGAFCL